MKEPTALLGKPACVQSSLVTEEQMLDRDVDCPPTMVPGSEFST